MALEAGGKDLGEVGVRMNRLIGCGPVLLGGGQVTGIDDSGNYVIGGNQDMGNYMVHMLKLQKLLAEAYGLSTRKNDAPSVHAGNCFRGTSGVPPVPARIMRCS